MSALGSRLCENSEVELSWRTFVSTASNKKRTALAGTLERRKERKQFCAFSARERFHTAWVISADFGMSAVCPLRGQSGKCRGRHPHHVTQRGNGGAHLLRRRRLCALSRPARRKLPRRRGRGVGLVPDAEPRPPHPGAVRS